MTDVRFYLEFPDRRTKKRSGKEHKGHEGNVFAIMNGYEGFGAVYGYPNSHVVYTSTSPEHIYQKCKRITETLARQIHPRLFERLDTE